MTAMRATPAMPPTTPPAIAPTGVELASAVVVELSGGLPVDEEVGPKRVLVKNSGFQNLGDADEFDIRPGAGLGLTVACCRQKQLPDFVRRPLDLVERAVAVPGFDIVGSLVDRCCGVVRVLPFHRRHVEKHQPLRGWVWVGPRAVDAAYA